jgi:hypothetical protein
MDAKENGRHQGHNYVVCTKCDVWTECKAQSSVRGYGKDTGSKSGHGETVEGSQYQLGPPASSQIAQAKSEIAWGGGKLQCAA